MTNFYRTKLARESVESGVEIDGISNIEAPEENLDVQLTELSSEDSELNQLQSDGQVLAEDTEQAEQQLDSVEAVVDAGEELSEEEAAPVQAIQESIRKRWVLDCAVLSCESFRGTRGRAVAAQEGWKETLKGLWERFIEFLKTVRRKAKEIKLKYFNAGKSAVKRANKFDAVLKNLKTKEKDDISGGFITKLSLNGKFDVDGSSKIAKEVVGGKAKAAISALETAMSDASEYVTKSADGSDATTTPQAHDVQLFGDSSSKLSVLPEFEDNAKTAGGALSKVMALPNNAFIQTAEIELKAGEGKVAKCVVVGYTTTGEATDASDIPTPSTSQLSTAIAALKAVGTGYEKVLKDFDAYDRELEKLERAADKASEKFIKATEDKDREQTQAAQKVASYALSNYQTINRAVNGTVNAVIAGLNGYIAAGIGAYKTK